MITALRRREDFHLLQTSGTTRRSGPLRARVVLVDAARDRHSSPHVKLGFTIGRHFGGAVQRNRMRRRLRHSMADAVQIGPVDTSHVLMGATPAALHSPYGDLVQHCAQLIGAGER